MLQIIALSEHVVAAHLAMPIKEQQRKKCGKCEYKDALIA